MVRFTFFLWLVFCLPITAQTLRPRAIARAPLKDSTTSLQIGAGLATISGVSLDNSTEGNKKSYALGFFGKHSATYWGFSSDIIYASGSRENAPANNTDTSQFSAFTALSQVYGRLPLGPFVPKLGVGFHLSQLNLQKKETSNGSTILDLAIQQKVYGPLVSAGFELMILRFLILNLEYATSLLAWGDYKVLSQNQEILAPPLESAQFHRFKLGLSFDIDPVLISLIAVKHSLSVRYTNTLDPSSKVEANPGLTQLMVAVGIKF